MSHWAPVGAETCFFFRFLVEGSDQCACSLRKTTSRMFNAHVHCACSMRMFIGSMRMFVTPEFHLASLQCLRAHTRRVDSKPPYSREGVPGGCFECRRDPGREFDFFISCAQVRPAASLRGAHPVATSLLASRLISVLQKRLRSLCSYIPRLTSRSMSSRRNTIRYFAQLISLPVLGYQGSVHCCRHRKSNPSIHTPEIIIL